MQSLRHDDSDESVTCSRKRVPWVVFATWDEKKILPAVSSLD